MIRLALSAAVVLSLVPMRVAAIESSVDRHILATNQLKRVAATISERCLADVSAVDDFRNRRTEFRQQLRDMLGLEPLPERTPLRAQVTGVLERPAYRIEKLVFQSLPGLYVTGNLYLPRQPVGPLPTILYLCGHAPDPAGAKVQYQDRVRWYACHGFAVLILDTLEFGEVPGQHHGLHDLNQWHWLSLGYSPAGVEVWNAMRALDYLASRPEVDAKRIGVTGISGGGAMTWYTAALDDRVAVAAPVCSTWTAGSQAAHWVASGQCDCIYYRNLYTWDFPLVGALIAPRPLMILSGRRDTDFPPDGYHAVYQGAKRVYDRDASRDSDRIREVDADVGHSDPPVFRHEVRQWMTRWLKGNGSVLPYDPAPELPDEKAEDLTCLKQLPSDAMNFRIQHEFVSRNVFKAPRSRTAWAGRRSEILGGLRDRVFRWFPANPIPFETREAKEAGGWAARYADCTEVSFQSEEGARIRGRLFLPKTGAAGVPLLIQVRRPGDSIYFMDLDELLPLLGRCAVLALNPRFTEVPIAAAEYRDLEFTASWCGRTVASMQVWDILRAVDWALGETKLGASEVMLHGRGDMGVLSVYAALFDDRVARVILQDPPATHWRQPALLNVLQVTDIPEATGALTPRQLVFLREFPAAFEPTRSIYRTFGAAKNLRVAGSLPEAIWLRGR